MTKQKCPECKSEYESVATHWAISNSCNYPEITLKQEQILTGVLMGDGTINAGSQNPAVQVKMITEEYLEYLHSVFGIMSTGVKKVRTAEECAEENKERGFSTNVNEENYSDQYMWRTRTNPIFNGFRFWYRSGSKVFPKNIILSPTVLRHWFVCDGSYCGKNSISISMANERGNKQKIESYFIDRNLPTPNTWQEHETSMGIMSFTAVWNKNESIELFEYMGYSLPGFEYKFPNDFPTVEDI
jgi:hypothetical protein